MKQTFTIEQIKSYLKSQDSFGDALYNLSEENILNTDNKTLSTDVVDSYGFEESDDNHLILPNGLVVFYNEDNESFKAFDDWLEITNVKQLNGILSKTLEEICDEFEDETGLDCKSFL